jgi:hypothetical protein
MPELWLLPAPDAETVGDLVCRALTMVGIQWVEREPGLIRIYAHPSLTDWLEEADWVELALTDTARQEHPEAQVGIAGSYALDRILELCRDTPRSFRTRAEFPLPEIAPSGAPTIDGEPPHSEPAGTVERWALRALIRVRVQSDEAAEHLVWAVLDGLGHACPEVAERWESLVTEVEPGFPELDEGLIAALETEAERLTPAVLEPHVRRIEERLAAETDRLEVYREALRGELSAQLPAGPARRLVMARTQAEELSDLIRSCLSGPEPFTRGAVLGTGIWPFRKPGSIAQLPGETHFEVSRLVASLPVSFTLADLDARLQQWFRPRLQRLEAQLQRAPDDLAALNAAEAEIEAAHQQRLEDIGDKFRVRAGASPAVLEALHYHAARFRTSCSALDIVWDPLRAAWEQPSCRSCGAPTPILWRLGPDRFGCPACASRCAGCGETAAGVDTFSRCACGAAACPKCGASCADCGRWSCSRHRSDCRACGRVRCAACAGSCQVCGVAACGEHGPRCLTCSSPLCAEHLRVCVRCEQAICPDHTATCPCCASPHCAEHTVRCDFCHQGVCPGCAPEGRCETCRSLAEPGEKTLDAVRRGVAAACADLRPDRLRGWRLGRNHRFRVIAASAWPRTHVIVLDDATGELVERYARTTVFRF